MGDIGVLMDQVKTMNLGKNKEMVKHLEQGIFTIRDMRDQLNNLMKMGPLSKLAGNIPGMSEAFRKMGAGSDEEGNKRMRRMMYMMDSMTEKGTPPFTTPVYVPLADPQNSTRTVNVLSLNQVVLLELHAVQEPLSENSKNSFPNTVYSHKWPRKWAERAV